MRLLDPERQGACAWLMRFERQTEGEAAPSALAWSMKHRPAVWLPAGGVGGDRPRRPARAGRNHGCSRLPHEPKRRENPLHRPGASTTRPPWPVDPEPAPPAGGHTARRSVQRDRSPPSRSEDRRQTDRRQTDRRQTDRRQTDRRQTDRRQQGAECRPRGTRRKGSASRGEVRSAKPSRITVRLREAAPGGKTAPL